MNITAGKKIITGGIHDFPLQPVPHPTGYYGSKNLDAIFFVHDEIMTAFQAVVDESQKELVSIDE